MMAYLTTWKKPEFDVLEFLDINNTSISLDEISRLNLSNIQKFTFKPQGEPNDDHFEMLRILKNQYPLCEIRLKHQLIGL